MAFEIHRREFFDPDDDADPEGKAPGHIAWRILSIIVVVAILIGFAYLLMGRPAASAEPTPWAPDTTLASPAEQRALPLPL